MQSAGEQMQAEEMSRIPTIPPAQISGYRIDRLLGRGAFGQVWVGVDRNTGRNVAIKFYLHHSKMDWKLLSREVRHLVSMAADRNIVQVLAVGWDHEPPYYVMEYLENGSLEDLIRRDGRLSVNQSLGMFSQIAAALKHSHGRGILHCDLKPANILLDPQLQPRIADFGQSRMSDEQTPSLGTLFYMAPEQADLNAMPDSKWDVYALGAILYCMLTGEPPYYSTDRVTTLRTAKDLPERLEKYRSMMLKSAAPKLHTKVNGVDGSLEKIVDRMLAPNPQARYENVQQVIDALNARDSQKLRKPLAILGIIGPIALLLVMSFFFWRGISTAKRQSTQRLQQEARMSNGYAAKLAARTLERDIATIYQLAEGEANRPQLREHLNAVNGVMNAYEWNQFVAKQPPQELLEKFKSNIVRLEMDEYIKSAFERFNEEERVVHDAAQIDSMFLLNSSGTMIGAAFSSRVSTRIGWNFAYRDYFNGLEKDGDINSQLSQFHPYPATHLSTPFLSNTTNTWKIAIATPVWNAPEDRDSGPQAKLPQGVLVVTINLGDFHLLDTDTEQADSSKPNHRSTEQFAVLVDGRSGDHQGKLVQHPLISKLEEAAQSGGANSSDIKSFSIDSAQLEALRNDGMLNYQDPVARHPLGKEYAGDWIANLRTIKLPTRELPEWAGGSGYATNDGRELLVLVQESAESTAGPVQELVNAMTREFIFAISVIVAVVGLLWYFGLKMFPIAASEH